MEKKTTELKKLTVTDIKTVTDLKVFLATNYMAQLKNFFNDESQAMKFMSSVMADVQKTPELLNCDKTTLINSYITMAQLGLMPSGISGEAYVLPYAGKAQFQLGYQGLITLFFRAGGTSIRSEIVRQNDDFSYENGVIKHRIDIFKSNKDRGEAVGAYAIAMVNGSEIAKAMNKDDITAMGSKFSKSYNSQYTPWKEKNDPELWMWKKTVLKQLAKMLPKNETIYKAITEDNRDSIISERKMDGLVDSSNLKMGNFIEKNEKNKEEINIEVEQENTGSPYGEDYE